MSSDAGPVTASRGLLGEAALALWGGVDPVREAEFNDWYTHEHLPERIAIPGFLRARRYVEHFKDLRLAGWRYFTLYEVECIDVLHSVAYLSALNHPTPQTLTSLPLFRAVNRMGCSVTHSTARGMGGDLFVAELGPRAGEADRLRKWLATAVSSRMLELTGALASHLCEIDTASTRAGVDVASYREAQTGTGRWLWLVEGAWTDPVAAMTECARAIADAVANGAEERVLLGMFRLLSLLTPGHLVSK